MDLKELLLPTKKRVITFDDLQSDEAIAFNWFYQKQKKLNSHNKLINNISTFDDLINYSHEEGQWYDLIYEIGYESSSNNSVEELLINCGVTIENTYLEVFTPIDELIDNYELDETYMATIKELKEEGYESILETDNTDILKFILKFFDENGKKYKQCDSTTYAVYEFYYTKTEYYKISGNNIDSLFYFFASLSPNIVYHVTETGDYYIGLEYPYEHDGYYDFNAPDALSCLISQGYIDFDTKDLIDYDTLLSSSKITEFFNSIKIENTREVIF